HRYALFPQKSGELTIPGVILQGVQPFSRRQNRGFGATPFGSFGDPFQMFNRGRRVHVTAKGVVLNVLPPEPGFPGNWWLPAQQITLSEQIQPDASQFRVGDHITRAIVLDSKGLSAPQLPEPEITEVDGLKLYPEPAAHTTRAYGDWILGRSTKTVAITPTRPGSYTLPEITIPWWDTDAQQLRTARLPERTLRVLPASSTASQAATAPADATHTTTSASTADSPAPRDRDITEQTSVPSSTSTSQEPLSATSTGIMTGLWFWISLVLAAILLVGLFLGFRLYSGLRARITLLESESPAPTKTAQPRHTTPQTGSGAFSDLEKACASNNPATVRDALLAWSGNALADEAPNHLEEVADALAAHHDDPQQLRRSLSALNAALYARNERESEWNGAELLTLLRPLRSKTVDGKRHMTVSSALPPLNPE
ncbi:MAG: BatD family protein, partial [Magnetococcales bacterium]|nr:BatD family protein [Magnetococcales bacterium]